MHSQEVSSRTTPTDSKYGFVVSYSGFDHANLAQLRKTKTDDTASEYHGAALAVTLSDWHVLLGSRKLHYILRRLDVLAYEALQHEKLCVIDSTIAFMGGLDLCFGRCVS
jgi:hypothetical protein